MKSNKIHVEKPSMDDAKKEGKKKKPDKKEPVTISKKDVVGEIGNASDTQWGKNIKSDDSKGVGSEITDGEEG